MKTTIIVLIAACLLMFVGTAKADYTYDQNSVLELDLVCDNVIGIMPHVAIQTTSNTEVCVQWYNGEDKASVPNGDQAISYYCRTTEPDGSTFFAYRARFVYHYPITSGQGCSDITWDSTNVDQEYLNFNIGLHILSIGGAEPDYSFIDVVL